MLGLNGVKSCNSRHDQHENALSKTPGMTGGGGGGGWFLWWFGKGKLKEGIIFINSFNSEVIKIFQIIILCLILTSEGFQKILFKKIKTTYRHPLYPLSPHTGHHRWQTSGGQDPLPLLICTWEMGVCTQSKSDKNKFGEGCKGQSNVKPFQQLCCNVVCSLKISMVCYVAVCNNYAICNKLQTALNCNAVCNTLQTAFRVLKHADKTHM